MDYLPISETAAVPDIAAMIGGLGRVVNRRSANVAFWDYRVVAQIDAKQRACVKTLSLGDALAGLSDEISAAG